MGIACREVVAIGDVVITLNIELVRIELLRLDIARVVSRDVTAGCLQVKRRAEQGLRYRVNGESNFVEGKRSMRVRIVDLICCNRTDTRAIEFSSTQTGEVSRLLRRGENVNTLRRCRVIEPLCLVIEEEEQLVLDNRSADRATKHVPAQFRPSQVLEVVLPLICVQLVIAEVLPQIAMKAVCA